MSFVVTQRERRGMIVLIALLIAVRLATLGLYPVMDATESRYAEIARKMLETGDWLVPQIAYGVPFWAKPPLSTWLSAASMSIFGVNEFAARLPSLLLMLGCGTLVFFLAGIRAGRDAALWASMLFATTGLVFLAAGAVMTDAALALGTTVAMAGFWIAVHGPSHLRRIAGLAFFLGLAIGMMAKGPVAIVLTFLPVGLWTLWTKSWRAVWSNLPWIMGAIVAAALVVPWYWAAERASPGFLDYFLIGEHWKRFVEPGWKGDLYGAAHARPRGMIWIFWVAAALPWSLPAIGWLVRSTLFHRSDLKQISSDPWQSYLLLWTIAPMLFFTSSGNVLGTYVLPGLPAFALLTATRWHPADSNATGWRSPMRLGLAIGLILPAAMLCGILALNPYLERERSHKALIRSFEGLRAHAGEHLIYLGEAPTSAEFYSRGKALLVRNPDELHPYINDSHADFIAVPNRSLHTLPAEVRTRIVPLNRYGEFQLFREVTGSEN